MEKLVDIIAKKVKDVLKKSNIIPIQIINDKISEDNNSYSSAFKLLNKKLIVEDDIKNAIKQNYTVVEVNRKAIITPLAKDIVLAKKIKLIKK